MTLRSWGIRSREWDSALRLGAQHWGQLLHTHTHTHTHKIHSQLFVGSPGDDRRYPPPPRKPCSCSHQHRRSRLGLGQWHYLCSDFLFSGEEVSGDAAAAGAEVMISALLVARIPVPSPPGGALGKVCSGGSMGSG